MNNLKVFGLAIAEGKILLKHLRLNHEVVLLTYKDQKDEERERLKKEFVLG